MAKANDERGVSPVIATILMVAITVVLAAVLYVMVTSIITQPLIQKPQVVLDNGSCTTTDCSGRVATASPATDLAQFRVTVAADGGKPFWMVSGVAVEAMLVWVKEKGGWKASCCTMEPYCALL